MVLSPPTSDHASNDESSSDAELALLPPVDEITRERLARVPHACAPDPDFNGPLVAALLARLADFEHLSPRGLVAVGTLAGLTGLLAGEENCGTLAAWANAVSDAVERQLALRRQARGAS